MLIVFCTKINYDRDYVLNTKFFTDTLNLRITQNSRESIVILACLVMLREVTCKKVNKV